MARIWHLSHDLNLRPVYLYHFAFLFCCVVCPNGWQDPSLDNRVGGRFGVRYELSMSRCLGSQALCWPGGIAIFGSEIWESKMLSEDIEPRVVFLTRRHS